MPHTLTNTLKFQMNGAMMISQRTKRPSTDTVWLEIHMTDNTTLLCNQRSQSTSITCTQRMISETFTTQERNKTGGQAQAKTLDSLEEMVFLNLNGAMMISQRTRKLSIDMVWSETHMIDNMTLLCNQRSQSTSITCIQRMILGTFTTQERSKTGGQAQAKTLDSLEEMVLIKSHH